jgi:hypothetical protein
MKTIRVVGDPVRDHTVIIEPLGELYSLPKAKTMTINTQRSFGAELEINISADTLVLWIAQYDDYDDTMTVTVDGQILPR